MQVDDQMALVRRFMLRLAPEVARASLRQLAALQRSPYIIHDEAEQIERLSDIARVNAQVTLQLAMHLAGTYAQFQDETEETAPQSHSAPAPNPAPTGQPKAPETTSDLHCAPESLPSPFPNVPSVRQRASNPDPSHLRSPRPDAE